MLIKCLMPAGTTVEEKGQGKTRKGTESAKTGEKPPFSKSGPKNLRQTAMEESLEK